jgi:hypothetical protein
MRRGHSRYVSGPGQAKPDLSKNDIPLHKLSEANLVRPGRRLRVEEVGEDTVSSAARVSHDSN